MGVFPDFLSDYIKGLLGGEWATLARDFISGYLTSIAPSFQQMLGEYRCRHTRNAGMPGDEQSLL